MKRVVVFLLLCGVFGWVENAACQAATAEGASKSGANGVEARERIREARRALEQGFPQAFLPELEKLAGKEELPGELREEALYLLAECLLAAGKMDAGLEVMEKLPAKPGVELLRGRAREAGGDFSGALEAFEAAAVSGDERIRDEAALGAASCLVALDRPAAAGVWLGKVGTDSVYSGAARLEEARLALLREDWRAARSVLASIPEVPPALQEQYAYLKASALLAEGDAEGALLVLGGSGGGEELKAEPLVVLRAQCLLATGQEAQAETVLEYYLRRALGGAPRLAVLELLDGIYAEQESPSISELRRLVADESQPARALDTAFFLARAEQRTGRVNAALGLLRQVAGEHSSPAMRNSARLAAAELLLKDGQFVEARAELDGLEAPEADFLRGKIAYELEEFGEAEAAFSRAREAEKLRSESVFNAAVCRLLGGEPGDENPWLPLLEADSGPERVGQLRLLAALEAARRRHPLSDGLFKEAWPASAIPWAEWRLISSDGVGAERLLTSGGETNTEAAEFLEIYLADDGTDAGRAEAMERAGNFLKAYPDSGRRREAAFKLAELEFARGDYLAARTRLEQLAGEYPAAAEAQQAWFLAGMASARLVQEDAIEQALLHFEEAAKAENELGWRARFEQALLLSARGAPKEALVLLDRVIDSTTEPGLRSAARIEKGDTLFSQAQTASDKAGALENAVGVWQDLAADTETPLPWREQALVKAGAALEESGQSREALQNYYRVVLGRESAGGEDFWFFKAGFEAARILEGQEAWQEAIRVYERLGGMGGVRGEEALARANRLRLEKFLWSE